MGSLLNSLKIFKSVILISFLMEVVTNYACVKPLLRVSINQHVYVVSQNLH